MSNTVRLNEDYPKIEISKGLLSRAEKLIPATTQTLAKGPGQHVRGIAPHYLERGSGAHVWDVDGNEYIDYTMGVGPLSLGYCYPSVDQAIREQLESGITFSLMHPLEVEVAELISSIIPNAEAVRYSKTGCDVTTAAIRLARAFTGKNKVLCCGYHGWHDWYIAVTDRNKGIPQEVTDLTYTFAYNDIDSVLNSIDDDTAAIILEPVVFEEPRDNFLHKLREICTEKGIVLIFDEMWTGFRMALGGAQEYFGIKADLATFSKAVANGMPLSILTGRADIMQLLEKDVFFFTTFGGEALSLAAAKATIEEMQQKDVISALHNKGSILKDGIKSMIQEIGIDFVGITGYPFKTVITFDAKAGNPLIMKSYMQQEFLKRGILWSGFHNMSYSHSDEDISYTLKAYSEVLVMLKKAIETDNLENSLLGTPIEPVFRRVGNFNIKPKN
ncbi:MAG: aminotransferase class III-fold pyridoxal phosphate-dependent enzyme [Candidatus Kapabacteria bacterium]|nr:aminotransferase class III-fold pyridoxal phosphate-dependent enzyme [Candidatus Kapabacteria bacterium]